MRLFSHRRYDLVAAGVGVALAAAMFPLRFVASQIYILTVPLVLGGACLLYLVSAYWDAGRAGTPTLSSAVARTVPGIVFAAVAAMVVLAVHAGERTLPFYALAAAVGSVLFVQLAFTARRDLRVGLVIAEMLVFVAVLRFAALYATPGFVGIDVWTHVNLTRDVLSAHSLSAIDGNKYYASPLYHLYLATAAGVLDLPLRAALYLTLGVVMVFSVALVYALARLLLRPRWAALATLLYAVGDYVVQWGIHLIPTSMGLAFYLVVLYALVRVTRTRYDVRDYALLVLASVAVILTHQVSSFIMVVTLGGAIATQVLLRLGLFELPDAMRSLPFERRDPTNLAGLFVFDLGFITFMWSLTPYKGDSFLQTVLSYLRETVASSAGFLNLASQSSASAAGARAAPTLLETLATYVDAAGYLLLLFATFLGCLHVVNRRRTEQAALTMLVATASMIVFVMGLPMFGIHNFIPTRWFAFLYAPMALLGAVGVRHLTTELDARVLVAVVVLFAALYPGAMLFSSDATVDNPVFSDQRIALAYDRPELAASTAIGDLTGSPAPDEIRPDQVVYTDQPYQTVIERRRSHPTAIAHLNDSGPTDHDVTVYRRAQTTEATYFSVHGRSEVRNVARDRICRPTQNVLYANGEVLFCTASG